MSNFDIGDRIVRRYSSLDQTVLVGAIGTIAEIITRGKFKVYWDASSIPEIVTSNSIFKQPGSKNISEDIGDNNGIFFDIANIYVNNKLILDKNLSLNGREDLSEPAICFVSSSSDNSECINRPSGATSTTLFNGVKQFNFSAPSSNLY